MDPTGVMATDGVTRALIQIAYPAVRWGVPAMVNRVRGRYWEIREDESHRVGAYWKWILRNQSGKSDRIYISAGDLFFMGPFLWQLRIDGGIDWIRKVTIRRISDALFAHLTKSDGGIPPLLPEMLLDRFKGHVTQLEEVFGADAIAVKEWPALPPFHGTMYHDFVHYNPWWVGIDGRLTHRTAGRFMRRDYAPLLFGRLEALFRGEDV